MAARYVAVDRALGFRAPLLPDNLFGHLVATGVPGVEEWSGGAYRRTLRLAGGPAIVAVRPAAGAAAALPARLLLSDPADEPAATAICRHLFDLDADPAAIDARLAVDPALAPLVAAAPGRRVPGAGDGPELALRAVLGQQVSTAAARTHAGRLVASVGEPVADPEGGLTHLFPEPAAVAGVDPQTLAMPLTRRRTLLGLAGALASGAVALGPAWGGGDAAAVRAALDALPGIGPWTIETVLMRALGDPDAFIPTDLGVRATASALGLPATPAALTAHAEAWRPYRAYAVQHLWATGEHAVNYMPGPVGRTG